MGESQQRGALYVTGCIENGHALVAVAGDLQGPGTDLPGAFLALLVAQDHPDIGGIVVEAGIPPVGFHGDLESLFLGCRRNGQPAWQQQ